jgi:cyclic pyranopterin phosphate synthase
MSDFSHINKKNQPKMVNVSDKAVTRRTAIAKATMFLGEGIISHFNNYQKRARFSNSNYSRNSRS